MRILRGPKSSPSNTHPYTGRSPLRTFVFFFDILVPHHAICAYIHQLCGDNSECIFDAVVVGLTVGATTLAAGDEFEACK